MTPPLIDSPENLRRLARDFGTPLWVYKWDMVASQVARLRSFDTIRFAQEACSNIHLLGMMRQAGVLVDAVSTGEIRRALHAGYEAGPRRHDIVFGADLLDREALARIMELDVPVNAGSVDMLEQLGMCRPGHRTWLRVNHGAGHAGIWHADVPRALAAVRRYKLRLEGIHVDEPDSRAAAATVELVRRYDIDVPALSCGEPGPDAEAHFALWDKARSEVEGFLGHRVRLEVEPGRFLVAGSGVLIAEVRATKEMGDDHCVMVDADVNELVRPAMYGSEHGVTLLYPRARLVGPARRTLVAGMPIQLPPAHVGDLLVFSGAGAFGASMSSCYHSRPLAPEVLIEGGTARLIRRRQTIAELLNLEQELPGVRARFIVRQEKNG